MVRTGIQQILLSFRNNHPHLANPSNGFKIIAVNLRYLILLLTNQGCRSFQSKHISQLITYKQWLMVCKKKEEKWQESETLRPNHHGSRHTKGESTRSMDAHSCENSAKEKLDDQSREWFGWRRDISLSFVSVKGRRRIYEHARAEDVRSSSLSG